MIFSDCPDNGLCCFDGCADTCVDGPRPTQPPPPPPPAPTPPPVQPLEAETEAAAPEVVTDSQPQAQEEAGYSYPVPDIPFELPAPSRPPPHLPSLYEVPF